MKKMPLAVIAAIACLALVAGQATAHGDEDHGQDERPAAAAGKSPAAATLPAEAASAQRLADGSLFVPKAVQRQLGLRNIVAEFKDLPATLALNGRIIADPNAGGRVQASQAGRIEPGPKGLPVLGQKVSKGQVLAWLQPASNSIDRGNQQAQLAELESQLAIGERKVRRYEQLEGSVPQKEIESARLELEAWKKRRAAVAASISTAEPLRAPVSGVISATDAVAGQVVEAKDVLFEVVDPARLAVEALAYDPALAQGLLEKGAAASAPLPSGALVLRFVGGASQLREQALPLLFRIESTSAAVVVGQPVKVLARTARKSKGVALPQASLSRNGTGEMVVWVHAAAERFVPRAVRFDVLDAATVAVTSGIRSGERIVTEGAGLLTQVR